MRQTELLVKTVCPECQESWDRTFEEVGKYSEYTTDCRSCKVLLMVKEGKVYPFYEYLHGQGSTILADGTTFQWPKDGASTGSVDF